MHEIKGLVSIIIPAYNAAEYLPITLNSIKQQSYSNWEVIIVDDGSKDLTQHVLKAETDRRIQMIRQQNQGVSIARNNGFKNAKGEFVVFFDADDIMTETFLQVRLNTLLLDSSIGFTGGIIETFPKKVAVKRAAGENAEDEILFFDKRFATVPSNYLFRKQVLVDHRLSFNTNLSSTADRFFLLQVSKFAKGKSMLDEKGRLLYRVSDKSMSHRVSDALILDNEKFYKELEQSNMLPLKRKRYFKCLYFYGLAMGFFKIRRFRTFIVYFLRSFYNSPIDLTLIVMKKSISFHR
jgi:glycosyltransferase involved in cell wall biosynthesis